MAKAIDKFFATTTGKNVQLGVVIGQAQLAASVIKVPGREPIRRDDSFTLDLGPGEQLAGKMLVCSTLVTDRRDETNDTSISMKVSDGVTALEASRQEAAKRNGGSVTYVIVLRCT
ncbi:MAG: hypothetical protein ACREKH_12385 [Candidatus Rokuibacteriota bacterium]